MYKCNHFYGICIHVLYMYNRKKNQNRELNYILNSNSFFLDTQHVIGMIGLQAWNSEKQKCCWKAVQGFNGIKTRWFWWWINDALRAQRWGWQEWQGLRLRKWQRRGVSNTGNFGFFWNYHLSEWSPFRVLGYLLCYNFFMNYTFPCWIKLSTSTELGNLHQIPPQFSRLFSCS